MKMTTKNQSIKKLKQQEINVETLKQMLKTVKKFNTSSMKKNNK